MNSPRMRAAAPFQIVSWMRASRFLILAFAFALVTLTAHAEGYLPKLGGPGGSQFNDPCPAGQNLAGFELRVGDDVDAIRPICVMAYGPKLVSEPVFTQGDGIVLSKQLGVNYEVVPGWHGGPGGHIERLLCPAATPLLLGMRVQREGANAVTVNSIELFCAQAVTAPVAGNLPVAIFRGKAYVSSADWLGIPVTPLMAKSGWESEQCPAGEVAVGLHGSTGQWVDSIGLICGPVRMTASPYKALGRVDTSTAPAGPAMTICDRAKSARARNSPAAASLEAQCRASKPAMELGRVKVDPSAAPIPICDAAASARDRNSPAAPGLAAQCLAAGGQVAPPASAVNTDELAANGEARANANPLAAELRARQPEGPMRRGFDVGMGATNDDTAWGPGKQKVLDSLPADQKEGFKLASSFALDYNRNAELATVGFAIAETDEVVSKTRSHESDPRYWLGFDIASGLFGDPAQGAKGNTAKGPGSQAIRDALSVPAQRGFDAAVTLHLGRKY